MQFNFQNKNKEKMYKASFFYHVWSKCIESITKTTETRLIKQVGQKIQNFVHIYKGLKSFDVDPIKSFLIRPNFTY